jgi:2,4-dienoyl-CoA reductase-like NADH-dependent reductase (Old Yellow Enzyme family)
MIRHGVSFCHEDRFVQCRPSTAHGRYIEESDMSSALFTPFTMRGVTLRNRLTMSPMCQYSATDGLANDWHLVHLGSRAVGGAGMVVVEDTAVSPEGRISHGDLGLWSDAQAQALSRIAAFVKSQDAVAGIQLGHAGRKASNGLPWEGGLPGTEGRQREVAEGGWEIVAPSAIAYGEQRFRVPRALTVAEIEGVQQQFVDAARRASGAGFEYLMLHASHGYLFQQFYSPLTNRRNDQYGGSFENRIRFTLETVTQVRAVWPHDLPLGLRLAGSDYIKGGWTNDEAIELARRLKAVGVDHIDNMAFGANALGAKVSFGPAFLAPDARRMKEAAQIATSISALSDPKAGTSAQFVADQVDAGHVDFVMIGRELLVDPYWPKRAATTLGVSDVIARPPQYRHWIG